MKSVHLDNLSRRTVQHARNEQLEELLGELRDLLGPVDEKISTEFTQLQWPPLLLVGSPRSGTTFVMQLLNATGQFAIPSNLLARFYYAPYIGARIQQLLTDKRFDYNDEMNDPALRAQFKSNLGKTTGALSPSEFTHFWRRFIPNYDPEYLSPAREDEIDIPGLTSGFASIEAVFGKPIATKAFILQYNLPKLNQIFDRGIFIQVQRNPLYVMQSIYEARKSFYNTLDIWWSVRPKEFEDLQKLDVYDQIAGQVYYTERALADGLSEIPEERRLVVSYEEVCRQPEDVYRKVREKYRGQGHDLSADVPLPAASSPSNRVRIPAEEFQKLSLAYQALAGSVPDSE